ncbi:hypothetical protein AB0H12_41800 [Actinosynnema sp. NPDC023794]
MRSWAERRESVALLRGAVPEAAETFLVRVVRAPRGQLTARTPCAGTIEYTGHPAIR